MIADLRGLREIALDSQLWRWAPPAVQRHWLLTLLSLLSEDSSGAWNAYCMMRAGVLDCMFTLISTGSLAPAGAHLLATRLALRETPTPPFAPFNLP